MRKSLRTEFRECPMCLMTATFDVYESWDRPESRRSRERPDLRISAKCTRCGFRLINLPA